MKRPRVVLTMSLLAAALTGCAAGDGDAHEPASFSGLVLDAEWSGRGPELCEGDVATSWPPQCLGTKLHGWDWGAIEHEEGPDLEDSENAPTRFGDYTFTGKREQDGTITVDPESVTFIPEG